MVGDIDLSGFVFTREEWLDLDEDERSELIEAASRVSPAAEDARSAPPSA